jgi:hypothetical protein
MGRYGAIVGLAVVACSSTGTGKDVRGGGETVGSPEQRKASSEQIPADVAEMMKQGSCVPKVRAPLEQHVLTPANAAPDAPRAFVLGIDERLCFVGGLQDPAAPALELSASGVELSNAKNALISVETRTTSIGTVMVIHNHHSRPLTYRAFIRPEGHDIQPTSVCPVRPGVPALEHWPYPIDVFSVGAFRLLEAGADMSCH